RRRDAALIAGGCVPRPGLGGRGGWGVRAGRLVRDGRRLARRRRGCGWRGGCGLLRRTALWFLPHHLIDELAAAARVLLVPAPLRLLPAVRRGRLRRGRLRVGRGRRRGERRRRLGARIARTIIALPVTVLIVPRGIGAPLGLAAARRIVPEQDEIISSHLAAARRRDVIRLGDVVAGDRVPGGPADPFNLDSLVDDAIVDVRVIGHVLRDLDQRDVARRGDDAGAQAGIDQVAGVREAPGGRRDGDVDARPIEPHACLDANLPGERRP